MNTSTSSSIDLLNTFLFYIFEINDFHRRMRTAELMKEIRKLPLQKRMYLVEKTLRSIREEEDINYMSKAADLLLDDYRTDKELTAFTNLDFEDFYEAR
jgi:hypothetical protein